MIIHRERRMIYVHIPKTGGTSVAQAFKDHGAKRWGKNHMNLRAVQENDKPPSWVDHQWVCRAFVWTVVRNPYARIVSRYNDAQNQHPERFAPGEKYEGVEDFADFVRCTIDNDYLRPQVGFIERELDYIGRTRSLQQDVLFVCRKRRMDPISIGDEPRSDHGQWRPYYAGKARGMVEDYYAEDFDRFGFPRLDNLFEDRPT